MNSSRFTTRPRQAFDHAQLNLVTTHLKDDRLTCGRSFRRERHRSAAGCDDDVHIPGDQIRSQSWQSLVLSLRPSIIDCDIAAFDIATFAEPFVESFEPTGE
jgi:hypothetical protein